MGCESSGVGRRAFTQRGHEVWSCDLLPADDGETARHFQCDLLTLLGLMGGYFDLLIAHPPCTDLAISGSRWFPEKRADGRQQKALDFVRHILAAPIAGIVVENPVSVISTYIRKPDQIVHPWMFGHTENKKTCLWLKGVPLLRETNNVRARMADMPRRETDRIHFAQPGADRWKKRSVTYRGGNAAMAEQWG